MSLQTILLGRDSLQSDDAELLAFVHKALHSKAKGEEAAFQELLETIKSGGLGGMKGAHQLALITCLSRCTASLTKKAHHPLVSAVLANCWRGGDACVDAAEVFAVNCVSVNAELVPSCILALVKQFLDMPLEVGAPGSPKGAVRCGDEGAACSSQGVHRVLQRVIETFPTGTTTLLTQLKEKFPHKRRDAAMQRCFLENILSVIDYVPQIVEQVLDEVVDRLIQIDVEIVVEDYGDDGDADAGDSEELFSMEMDNARSLERKENMARAEKLDAMMLITFDFLKKVFSSSKGVLDRDLLFNSLLNIFDRRILTTFRSKYTQFLLFYASHFRTRYIQSFLSHLLKITTANTLTDTTLLAASCYVGSFLARAGFARLPLTATALRLLSTWVHEYIEEHDADADPFTHSHFYSVVQSLMYALCFKLKPLLAGGKNTETLVKFELRLDRIVACKLNPLKVVNPMVADQFIKVALQQKVLDRALVSPILKRNSALVLPGAGEAAEENSFFPFDPYLLAASKGHIDAIYQDWQGQADSDEEDDDWAAGIASSSEHTASEKHSLIEDSIAMSLNSQLSLSDPDGNNSPSWKPMSFSPTEGSLQRKGILSQHHPKAASPLQPPSRQSPSSLGNVASSTQPSGHNAFRLPPSALKTPSLPSAKGGLPLPIAQASDHLASAHVKRKKHKRDAP